jgi:hypothetical protein
MENETPDFWEWELQERGFYAEPEEADLPAFFDLINEEFTR